MKTLVLVEHDGKAVKDATLSAVTAASKLGEVHLLVAGEGVGPVAEQAAKIAGVGKVHVADDAAYANGLAENVAPLAAALMADHDAFLAPATTQGKNVAPRVAVPRPPSLADARQRMRAGRTFWDDLTPEQRAAGLDGPEASGRGPTLARSAER